MGNVMRLLRWLRSPEIIGDPACPIMRRWTIVGEHSGKDRGRLDFKLMVHHFLPNADDRDMHDHPRPFVTLVLRGAYQDRTDDGVENMTPGRIRLRRAEHKHITRVCTRGCWTVVGMGPLQREWGFWKGHSWLPWRKHGELYGFGMRCD